MIVIDTLSQIGPYGVSPVETTDPGQKETEENKNRDVQEQEFEYILNTNTRKFHYPDCKSVKRMSEKNKREYYGTRQSVIDMGYEPCGNCHP